MQLWMLDEIYHAAWTAARIVRCASENMGLPQLDAWRKPVLPLVLPSTRRNGVYLGLRSYRRPR